MTQQLTVFVVDDDQDFRDSLTWFLEGSGYHVCAYPNAEAFLAKYRAQPGCLVLDVQLSGMSGLALQQELNRRGSCLPVIVISGHGDVPMAVQAMKNKAMDFIEKPVADDVLLGLVDQALAEAAIRFSAEARQQQLQQRWQSLSKREAQVAECVIASLSNREVGEKLGISIKTVEIHRSRVMSKLGVKKVTELVSLYARY